MIASSTNSKGEEIMRNTTQNIVGSIVALAFCTAAVSGTAGAGVLEGDGMRQQPLPECSATQRAVIEVDSPMAEAKALAIVGLDGPDPRAELQRVQVSVRVTCR